MDPVSNPGLRGERPATNHLSHGTAQSAVYIYLTSVHVIWNTFQLWLLCRWRLRKERALESSLKERDIYWKVLRININVCRQHEWRERNKRFWNKQARPWPLHTLLIHDQYLAMFLLSVFVTLFDAAEDSQRLNLHWGDLWCIRSSPTPPQRSEGT
jgi:hypothetical protein